MNACQKQGSSVQIDVQDGVEYVVLCRQSHFPKLARQILQLLMNQSSGSLPLVELCSRYKTSFGTDCDVGQIREELLDFVQVIETIKYQQCENASKL